MKICKKYHSIKEENGYYSVLTDGAEIRIIFLTDSIVRIRAAFDGAFSEESYSLMLTAWPDYMDKLFESKRKQIDSKKVAIEDEEDRVILNGKSLRVVIEKEPFRICIYDKDNTCLHADLVDMGYMLDSNQRCIHTSEISLDDYFYGFGEKTGDINKAQKFMCMSSKDAMGYNPKETDCLYKHIPFYIKLNANTQKAVGYFYHNTYECDFNMGKEHSNYWKRHSRFRADGGDIDLFFIAGPSINEVVERYTDLTGKSALLPRYALGYMGSSMYYAELEEGCDDAIINFVDIAKKEEIPMDGFQLSSGYCTYEGKRCVFMWNDERFKNPSKFFEEMNAKGVVVSPNVKPGLLLMHPLLDELKKEDIFIKDSSGQSDGEGTWWGGKGLFVDFTKQHARDIWKKYLKKYVLEYGTSSIWNDNCEYDSIVDKDYLCNFEGKGATIGQLRAVMPNLMCYVAEEAIKETFDNVRPFIVCRSGYAGIQQYAQTWAGDNYTSWDSLKYNIATILGMGLSGVSNHGCDIGGFYGPAPEPELLVRWVQNGIFQPRFSIHSTNTDNTVTEPWMYSSYKEYIKRAIQFRYKLIPYFYSLMERAHTSGLPMLQTMFSVFQYDKNCYEEGINFMLGDGLLIANVVEKGAKVKEVYLPEGEVFYDFYTRECYKGGQTIEIPVTIDSIPIFIRGGAIVPLAKNKISNLGTQNVTDLHILLTPDKNAEFTMYEDDGISFDYEKGEYLKTKISMTTGEKVVLDFNEQGSYNSFIKTMYLDMIQRDKAPYMVQLNSNNLTHYLYEKEFEKAQCGWYYNQELKSVQIKYKKEKGNHQVIVSFEQMDMLGM